jgi:hypothetical protein
MFGACLAIRCPRNNQILFSVRTETNWNSFCFGCFSVCFAKPTNIFSVCFGVSDRYRNNWNKQNFLETNRKNLQKTFSIRGSSKPLILFLGSNRNKPKLSLFRLSFGLLFRETKHFFFGLYQFVSMFRTGIETTGTKRTYGMGNKKVDILTKLLLFRFVFCLFQLFRNTKTPCFDIKAKQPKQKSCFG